MNACSSWNARAHRCLRTYYASAYSSEHGEFLAAQGEAPPRIATRNLHALASAARPHVSLPTQLENQATTRQAVWIVGLSRARTVESTRYRKSKRTTSADGSDPEPSSNVGERAL